MLLLAVIFTTVITPCNTIISLCEDTLTTAPAGRSGYTLKIKMDSLFSQNWQKLPTMGDIDFGWQNPWIYDQGSLTEKLSAICNNELRVKVLHHAIVECTEKTAKALDLDLRSPVLHREVVLCDGDTPLVFASSLLPEIALVDRFDELRRLGSRPLGHWIFSEPVLTRSMVHIINLPCESHLFKRLNPKFLKTPMILGRKTLFTGPKKPFLVSEFFLSEIQSRN